MGLGAARRALGEGLCGTRAQAGPFFLRAPARGEHEQGQGGAHGRGRMAREARSRGVSAHASVARRAPWATPGYAVRDWCGLEAALGMQVADSKPGTKLRARALRRAGAAPASASWPRITRRSTAFAALGSIARAQLAAFAASEPGMRRGEAAALHAGRVALRRLRVLIGQLEGVLARAVRDELCAELRGLARRLGPARDLDTLLEELRAAAKERGREAAPLVAELERRRARRSAELRRVLASARCKALRARLRSDLAPEEIERHGGRHAARPFARVLARRLRRRLRRVRLRARELRARPRPAELHELRIACKKLRYLLERCRGLVPRAPLEGAFATLKRLQDELGTIQDARVHAALVDELAPGLRAEAGATRALARLRARSELRSAAALAAFIELADELGAPESRRDFEAVLGALERGRAARA